MIYLQKVVLMLLTMSMFLTSKSQSTVLDSVYSGFVSEYASNLELGKDFYNSFRTAIGKNLSNSNQVFVRLIYSIEKQNVSIKEGQSFDILFDSIISRFIRTDLWIDKPYAYNEVRKMLSPKLNSFCSCVTPFNVEMLNTGVRASNEAEITDSCFSMLISDADFKKQMQEFLQTIPKEVDFKFNTFFERYLFETCIAVQRVTLLAVRMNLSKKFYTDKNK